MESLKKTYYYLKQTPVLGWILIKLRSEYKKSFLYKLKLRRKDINKTEAITTSLFGEKAKEYLKEIQTSSLFRQDWSYGHSGDFDFLMLYVLTRAVKPNTVVETGVASGRSSTAILAALEKNKKGTLYSIDLAQVYDSKEPGTYITHEGNEELKAFVPAGKQPGWLVPDNLRARWKLIIGDAKKELVNLMSELESVDIFYHDSDHSEDHMLFEFNTVAPKISQDGFVLSDDVNWNTAWKKFVELSNVKEICIYRNMGVSQLSKSV